MNLLSWFESAGNRFDMFLVGKLFVIVGNNVFTLRDLTP